jgi:hypothetical protein
MVLQPPLGWHTKSSSGSLISISSESLEEPLDLLLLWEYMYVLSKTYHVYK